MIEEKDKIQQTNELNENKTQLELIKDQGILLIKIIVRLYQIVKCWLGFHAKPILKGKKYTHVKFSTEITSKRVKVKEYYCPDCNRTFVVFGNKTYL